jgi:O-antigen ligase
VILSAYLIRFIHIGLYLILLTPLLVWTAFLQPYVTAKVLAFQILVELIAAAALILIFLGDSPKRGKTHPFFSPLFVSLAGFLAYSLLSAGFGIDLNLSLWGIIDRQDGLVLMLHFLVWAALLAWFCHGEEGNATKPIGFLSGKGNIHSFMYFSFWISVVVALSALRESGVTIKGGVQPLLELLSSPVRPGGVFGNSLALGPYLTFHFFWGIYFLITGAPLNRVRSMFQRNIRGRILRYASSGALAVGEILLLLVLAAGQSRGVILGLIAGIIVFCALFTIRVSTLKVVKALGAAFVACVVLAGPILYHYRDSSLVAQIPLLQRMTHLSAAENVSTSARLMSWNSALRGFWDHPLFGWGSNNIYYSLNRYYDPRHIRASPFLRDNVEDTWYDKSHNFFIDLLVERGIIGLLSYLLLLGVIARSLWRLRDRHLAVCLAGSLVAYLISNAVAFDSFGSLLDFFLTLACILSLGEPEPLAQVQSWFVRPQHVSKSKKKKAVQARRKPMLAFILLLAVPAIALYLTVETAIANHKYVQARAAFAQDPAIGTSLYVDAFTHFSPYDAREKLNCAYLIVNSVITKRQASQSFDAGMLIMRLSAEAIAAHPRDAAFYMILNDIFNGLTLYVNREFAPQAEAFGRKAVELSPNRQEAIFQLARTYVIRNEAAKAVDLNRRMLQSADFPLGHWLLGLSLLQNNQREEAKAEIRKAIEMGYQLTASDSDTLKGLLGEKEFAELTTRR